MLSYKISFYNIENEWTHSSGKYVMFRRFFFVLCRVHSVRCGFVGHDHIWQCHAFESNNERMIKEEKAEFYVMCMLF